MPHPLQIVDFLKPDNSPAPGLVHVSDPVTDRIEEKAFVRDARRFKYKVDYVFFRRYTDGRSSKAMAYVIDATPNKLTEDEIAELHSQMWIQGLVPLLYVGWRDRIDILSCARGSDFWDERKERNVYNPADTFKIAAAIDQKLKWNKYSAYRLADGRFWEHDVKDNRDRQIANYDKAAHKSLIQAVMEADKELGGNKNQAIRKLLLLIILIKYLEDRRVFQKSFFSNFNAENILDIFKNGDPKEVLELLFKLEKHFNGDIFRIHDSEKNNITKDALRELAVLIEGRTLDSQRFLWKQFSFEHLPVEIISNLYQGFIPKDNENKGSVYTPPILADLLLDQVMPYDELEGNERILDPACGSGVFLVGAFKRLINTLRFKQKIDPNDTDIFISALKNTINESIFGVDLNSFALRLTSFSLSLAICDALHPKEIWEKLKFDPLIGSNLIESDFFTEMELDSYKNDSILNRKLDYIIGNPPFKRNDSASAKEIEKVEKKNKNRGKLPDNQMAYLFLEQSMKLLRSNGKCCLIQPSGFLYNSRSKNFKFNFFKCYQVKTVLDFTSIRGLFGESEADTKTIAILSLVNSPLKNNLIEHLTFRRTKSIKERVCFELDYYDFHKVTQERATTDEFIWRINLINGGRLIALSDRFRKMNTLGNYLNKQNKLKNWEYGEGFVIGDVEDKDRILTGKPFLERPYFVSDEIDTNRIKNNKLKLTHFSSDPQNKKGLFHSPLILLKLIFNYPILFWEDDALAYRKGILGIHAPENNYDELFKLYQILKEKREIFTFSSILNGYRALTGNATSIDKQEVDIFPFPEEINELNLVYWEEILKRDVQKYLVDYIRLGQESKLLKDKVEENQITDYSDVFVKMLGSIYENLKATEYHFAWDGFICQPFYFGDKPNLSWVVNQDENTIRNLIIDENYHGKLRTYRILRYYDKNVILIIKPDRLRYWIRSTAIRDADDTLVDLFNQGY